MIFCNLCRFAKAKLMLKDCNAALGLVKNGLKIDPNDPHLQQLEKEVGLCNNEIHFEICY